MNAHTKDYKQGHQETTHTYVLLKKTKGGQQGHQKQHAQFLLNKSKAGPMGNQQKHTPLCCWLDVFVPPNRERPEAQVGRALKGFHHHTQQALAGETHHAAPGVGSDQGGGVGRWRLGGGWWDGGWISESRYEKQAPKTPASENG